jgi:hypothetical protein
MEWLSTIKHGGELAKKSNVSQIMTMGKEDGMEPPANCIAYRPLDLNSG